ncbi:MAG: DUF2155 domain-containing protein [Deltaproteobacteria bacterium]|nr:DUF2155 domain-containing protein [Deltaproteobacteria bacterium]
MKKQFLLVILLATAILAAPGCKKKQPPPKQMSPPGAQAQPGMPGMPGDPHGGAPVEKKVVVPAEVRDSWKAVKISLEFKQKKEKKEYVVPLNSEFKVPDTGLTLKTGAFFPHFKMAADQITSESNKAENPALQIEVIEGGKEIFHGWLFAKFPEVHSLVHDKYAIALVEGVKK